MGRIETLELENFKSFKGKHVVGPFKKFTAIIGPNGSGKSNLMDAISFVLGEKSTALRVRRIGDLIHGASINKPYSNTCRVTLNYIDDEENKRIFTRAVKNQNNEYRVDKEVVTTAQYNSALQSINVFIKAHNFLVFQGEVEQIAMRSPKDLTEMFEELSKSAQFKNEYERLKSEVEKAESETVNNFNKRRDVEKEKKLAKQEKDMARNFDLAKEDFAYKSTKFYIAKLFAADLAEKKARNQKARFEEELDEAKESKQEHDSKVQAKRDAVRQRNREVHKLENKVLSDENNVTKEKPELLKLNQQKEHIKKRLEVLQKSQQAAQKKAEEHEKNISDATKKLDGAKKQKEKLEAALAAQSEQSQLKLDSQQIDEYRALKAEAEKRTMMVSSEIYNKQQEMEHIQSLIDFEKQRLVEWKDKERRAVEDLEKDKRICESIQESNERTKERLQNERGGFDDDEEQMRNVKQQKADLQEALADIQKQLSDADGDTKETRREQLKNEALENMKRIFGDHVYGRIVEFCSPVNKRYNVAITKILAKHMNSIVVDTDDTARACINYLHEQRSEPETFLPLNTIEVSALKEQLRNMRNAKLVYDVIQCSVPEAKKAVQFACGNALVADSIEVARDLAYGTDRYKAVTENGTLFNPEGTISGGSSDLKQRSKKWDGQQTKKLKDKKRKIEAELAEIQAATKSELELEMKRREIRNMENRIKYTEQDLERRTRELEAKEGEVIRIRSGVENSEFLLREKNEELAEEQEKIDELIAKRDQVESLVFEQFCQRIGIINIKEYEENELHFHEEQNRKINECLTNIEKFKNELEYLKTEDRQAVVEREAEKITKLKKEEKATEKKYKEQQQKVEQLEQLLNDDKELLQTKKVELEEAEAELNSAKKEGQEIDKAVHAAEKKILSQDQTISRKAEQRHALLLECKVQNVDIPLISGSIDSLVQDESDESQPTQSTSTEFTQRLTDSIQIDFSSLSNKEKRKYEDETNATKEIIALQKAMAEAEAKLGRIAPPIIDVNQRMEEVKGKEKETIDQYENARKHAQKLMHDFDKVKQNRLNRFSEFFDPVAQHIDEIYKGLTKTQSAQAYLGPMNHEEPYNDGIQYNCIAPGKRFRPMDNLSGGEKTIAALALLFAIHGSKLPSPFFVLDEVDAALDNTNIGLVVNYMRERSRTDLQVIVISLKEEMYSKADGLIGVYPKKSHPCISSGIITMDLENKNEPFAHYYFEDFIENVEDLDLLQKELDAASWNRKENDLYSLNQTSDLKLFDPDKFSNLCSFRNYLKTDLKNYLADVTRFELNDNVAVTGSKYCRTDTLLPHDDSLDERAIAFVLYLSDDFTAKDGGDLIIYKSDPKINRPVEEYKRIIPKKNTLLIFPVQTNTWHAVSEVLSDRVRLTVNGWFHVTGRKSASDPAPEKPLVRLTPGLDIELNDVHEWVNPTYVDEASHKMIKKKFCARSQLTLDNFLSDDCYDEVLKELKSAKFDRLGTADRRRIDRLNEEAIPKDGAVQKVLNLFRSQVMSLLLTQWTGLDLINEEREEEPASKKPRTSENGDDAKHDDNPVSMLSSLNRVRHSYYSLVDSQMAADAKNNGYALDLMIFFMDDEEWPSEAGGFISYLAENDPDELLRMPPRKNSLAIVFREPGVLSFTKYVNCNIGDKEYFGLNLTYFGVCNDDEDEAEDDEDEFEDELGEESEEEDEADKPGTSKS
ncbi:unnamed protein product [Bursaphelenchus okinawaensis]|uniref:Structural maintenance of chromosomes protein n=1 Tax=Bursaphelenchus okinawaensis TaxID=465554 RepID=A0A811KVD6_9BILA|nr:unnamed protein product [Bursaphelenchus okinawaensis]CAG9112871.1 unnamed protein product [Bursaphelenchus okinawaensis]